MGNVHNCDSYFNILSQQTYKVIHSCIHFTNICICVKCNTFHSLKCNFTYTQFNYYNFKIKRQKLCYMFRPTGPFFGSLCKTATLHFLTQNMYRYSQSRLLLREPILCETFLVAISSESFVYSVMCNIFVNFIVSNFANPEHW
jgi:hypothetical protein